MALIPENQRLLDAICRTDFVSFAQKTFHTLSPSSSFSMNYHIEAVAYQLELVRLGKTKRLIDGMARLSAGLAFEPFIYASYRSKFG
jgi:hypothetical protein